MTPYYADASVTLYQGDCREVLPALEVRPDCIVTDPPYGETGLRWDRWPAGWPSIAAGVTRSMWCFGSMRMFLARHSEFTGWQMSQDVVWEKNTGSGPAADRLRRVHEHVLHWYTGTWAAIHHEVPKVARVGPDRGTALRRSSNGAKHFSGGHFGPDVGWVDDGTRQVRSVIKAQNLRGLAVHPTEKPVGVLDPLIRYACPPGGWVLDPFAGSGSTAVAARLTGRHALLIEADERYCEAAANRLAQDVLPLEAS